jgi:hypothetical protein
MWSPQNCLKKIDVTPAAAVLQTQSFISLDVHYEFLIVPDAVAQKINSILANFNTPSQQFQNQIVFNIGCGGQQ